MRMLVRVIAAVWLLTFPAFAQTGDGPTQPDLFVLPPVALAGIVQNLNVNGATIASPQALDLTKKNLILIAAGQSNISNMAPTAFTTVNPTKLFNLNIYDGAIYKAADPLLGCSTVGSTGTGPGNPMTRLADAIVTAGYFDNIYIVPVAVSGTLVSYWETGNGANILAVTFRRLANRGIVAGANVTIIVVWAQGEQDNSLGTSQAAYTASLNNVIAATRASGFNGTWFVAEETYNGSGVSSAIQAAQAAVVNHGAGVWAGPNADTLVGNVCGAAVNSACRNATDLVHWIDAGSYSDAAIWLTALQAFGAPF